MAKQNKKSISKALGIGSIKSYNRILASIFALQAVAIITQSQKVTIPVVQNYILSDNSLDSAKPVLFELIVPSLLAFILLVSAVSYLLVSTSGMGWYLKNIKHKLNYMRWLQFSVSGSMLTALVALVSGFNDSLTLSLIIITMVSVSLYGLLMERINERKRKIEWRPYIFSIGIALALIGSLFLTFLSTRGTTADAANTASIWMFTILLLTHVDYALIMLAHYKKFGIFKDYLNTEEAFMLVDLISKSVITWIIYFTTIA